LSALRDNARRLYHPGSQIIAQHILEALKGRDMKAQGNALGTPAEKQ
jgi:hypothetical protein